MELTINERLTLMMILPAEGRYNVLKLLRVLKDELSFNDDEHKQFKIRSENNRIVWDAKAGETYVKDVHIGEILSETIQTKLKKLEKNGKLMEGQVSLYEKFVVEN